MADDKGNERPKRPPITPEVRKRLQDCFQRGGKVSHSGQFDYATDMFSPCVTTDPANHHYLRSFLGNLQKKYNNNKKGAGGLAAVGLMGAKAILQKNVLQQDWMAAIKTGVDILKVNPWDVGTLMSMATACEPSALDCPECRLIYLQTALEVNLKDPAVNKRLGQAHEDQERFDQAIICWRRVEENSPKDVEEARKKIGDLAVKRTIDEGGYQTASSSQDVKADRTARPTMASGGGIAAGTGPEPEVGQRLTPEELLKRQIKKEPGDLSNYLQLADQYKNAERWREAEAVYAKALQAAGGDATVQERLEDVQIVLRGQELHAAQAQAAEEQTDESRERCAKLSHDLNQFEMGVYRRRAERNPTVKGLWAEYAQRLQNAGLNKEAIQAWQKARGDETRKGAILFGLGRCFHAEKRYKLALSHYQEADAAIPDSEADTKKEVLYAIGTLAEELNDRDTAIEYLNRCASIDYGYKDVAERLDRLEQS